MTHGSSAFDRLREVAEYVREKGTHALPENQLERWGMERQSDGTYIGYTFYSDGTAAQLSAGEFVQGTEYPSKFGIDVRRGDTNKLAWFDWNEKGSQADNRPHFQFADNCKKRLYIDEESSWEEALRKINALRDSSWQCVT